jgi:hypothetical protein
LRGGHRQGNNAAPDLKERAMKPWPLILSVAISIAMAGCGIFLTPQERAIRKDPNYRTGYSDGCGAANAENSSLREKPTRDEVLYRSDKDYRNGWQSGYASCRSSQSPYGGTAGTTSPQRGPIPDPYPGH